MGKQPAVVIIARHGARLDQADKKWHLTSPTPYDPPLSYGGWTQCQTLGARIASILQAREEAGAASSEHTKSDEKSNGTENHSHHRPRKRQRIFIHSSPFLRCIQTSVAISAGIGQFEKRGARTNIIQEESSHAEEHSDELRSGPLEPAELLPTTLKVDPFLGEWLSPDYYENITPPPSSMLMVAGAKGELLRPAEEIRGADLSGSSSNRRSSAINLSSIVSGKVANQPFRSRAISFNNEMRTGSRLLSPTTINEADSAYNPPIPTYAISNSDKIPSGFFAHARDACVNIDFQWDSMKDPHNWGNGGEFGEEWSSMHRRFRNGLQQLLAYYENGANSQEDEDVVLMLVTHGAGCNALIGAMTSAPVLLDVGVASLTMAVRKDVVEQDEMPVLQPTRTRRGSIDLGISQNFDMKIVASTEHLRAATNPLGLNSPRLGRSPAFASRRLVGADSPDGFTLGDPLAWRPSSSSGLGRSGSQRSTASAAPVLSSSGLWSTKSRLSRDDTADSSESDSLPNFDGVPRGPKNCEPNTTDADKSENVTRTTPLPLRTASQQGLWGSGDAVIRDESSHKRRWTLVDATP